MKSRAILAFTAWIIVCVGGSAYCSVAFSRLLSNLNGHVFSQGRVWFIDIELVAICGMLGLDAIKRYLKDDWPFATERN